MKGRRELTELGQKVVVVTGGAGFLGRGFCSAIAASGAVAVVADLALDAAQKVADEINETHPGHAFPTSLDITSKESISNVIDTVRQKYGVIDALVNNAYPRNNNYGRQVEDVAYDDFCENLGMHAGGYFLAMQQFGKYFKSVGSGNIINMSSIYGVIPPRFNLYDGTTMTMPVEYAAIKAGVLHLTKYFAQYLKGCNIRVNAVSPGGILDRQPEKFLEKYKKHCGSKGMLSVDDVTGTVLFLLSDASLYLSGQNIIVDDGFSL